MIGPTAASPARIAQLLLPLLSLVMFFGSLYLLLEQRETTHQVHKLSTVTHSETLLQSSRVGDMQNLKELSVTLARWLKQGRSTEEAAPKAQLLASLVAQADSSPSGIDTTFWQQFSRRLSELEQHVRDKDINTPEARALITELRNEYALLREAWHKNSGLSVATNGPQLEATSGANNSPALAATIFALQSQQARTRILLWALLGLSALATFLGVVLWLRSAHRFTEKSVTSREPMSLGTPVESELGDGGTGDDQLAILKLLDEMTPLASGDLRVTATVSEAMTGALADAFNFAVLELRRLVGEISSSAIQINTAIESNRVASRKMANAGSVQSREVLRSSNYLNAMSDAMAQLSAHAAESSSIAESSVERAHAARQAAALSQESLQSIKAQADATSTAMRRLVLSTESIQARVSEIKGVASRTDLLALNTTIQAAANADFSSTTQFAQLSDEVTTLADCLGSATRDIVYLVENIQTDAQNTLACMRQTQSELEIGNTRVEEVGAALIDIDQTTQLLQSHVTDMAGKALKQAGVVKQLSQNMGVINELTRDTAVDLASAATEVDSLYELAVRLRRSVAGFNLPTDREKSTGHLPTLELQDE